MNKSASSSSSISAPVAKPQEKILFETQALLLPTILNLENLTLIGFTLVIMIAAVVFHFGLLEFILVGVFYLLLAVPSFNSIFRAGSTTYVLTNYRLVIFTVGLGQKERSIPLEQIQDVKVKTSGLQRFYGAGDILIYPKGLRKSVRMYGLKNVHQRAEQVQQAVKRAHSRG